ncbi:MAG: universal stress protein [Thermodesulfobacteriota bacterium]|nr:universal stress protein [Thermodesulfobacteriota bacterium]
MNNILIATDLTSETDHAFERAVNLALALSAKLHILHVCPSYSFRNTKKLTISLKQDAETTIKKHLDNCKEVKNLKCSITVVDGREVFAEIIDHAEKVKADLIVMGMHGKAKLLDMFVGTTIERVARKGTRPILMVKDKLRRDYKNILVGTDFSTGSKQALCVALELAPNSFFHLVHSFDFPDTYTGDKIAQYAGDVVVKFESLRLEGFVKENKKILQQFGVDPQNFHFWTTQGAVYPCLIREVAAAKADLIAIGTHSHLNLMPFKLGGTAQDILADPPCDVLVARGFLSRGESSRD